MLFVIRFCVRLSSWDHSVPGYCYNSPIVYGKDAGFAYIVVTSFYSLVALFVCYRSSQNGLPVRALLLSASRRFLDRHPLTKKVAQCLLGPDSQRNYVRSLALLCSVLDRDQICGPSNPHKKAPNIAIRALIQYPLHLTMAIIVRKQNERLLEGDSENQWGFGQIVALLLCAGTLVECFRSRLFVGIAEAYWKGRGKNKHPADSNRGDAEPA